MGNPYELSGAGPDDCALPVPEDRAGALSALGSGTYTSGGSPAGPLTPPCVLGAISTGSGP